MLGSLLYYCPRVLRLPEVDFISVPPAGTWASSSLLWRLSSISSCGSWWITWLRTRRLSSVKRSRNRPIRSQQIIGWIASISSCCSNKRSSWWLGTSTTTNRETVSLKLLKYSCVLTNCPIFHQKSEKRYHVFISNRVVMFSFSSLHFSRMKKVCYNRLKETDPYSCQT